MIVEKTDPHSPPADLVAFVENNRLFFNRVEWLRCYPAGSIRQAVIRNKNREVIGCFVYYLFRKAAFRFIITAPYTPNLALYYLNPAESTVSRNTFSKDLLDAMADFFLIEGVSYINLNLPAEVTDTQPFLWKGYQARSRFTYYLDLRLPEEVLLRNLSSEKRKSLNKAAKDNLQISPSDDPELIYGLIVKSLSRSRKDKNLSVIKKIISAFCTSGNGIAYVARIEGKPVAATFCVIEKNRATYLFGGYDAERMHHGASVSCMWQSILEARRKGLEIFDFEGSMHRNIERYYREFGPELVQYQCIERIKPILNILLKMKGHRPL